MLAASPEQLVDVLKTLLGPADIEVLTGRVAAFLLDSYDPDLAGGTGTAFKWDLASGLRATAPVILSGGLTPDNVWDALETVQPYAVDVSSGVETDGRKDHAKMRAFIDRVREWSAKAASPSTLT